MSWTDGLPSRFREEEITEVLALALFDAPAHLLSRRQWTQLRDWRDQHPEWQLGDPIRTTPNPGGQTNDH